MKENQELKHKLNQLEEENKRLKDNLNEIQNNYLPLNDAVIEYDHGTTLFGKLFNNTSLPIIITDQSLSKIINTNKAAQQLYGYNKVIFRTLNFYNLFFHNGATQNLDVYLTDKEIPIQRVKQVRADGSVFDVDLFLGLYRANGKVYYYHIIHDISHFTKQNDLLKESEKNFRLLIHKSPQALIVTNYKGKVVYINKKFKLLFGFEDKNQISHINDWITAVGINKKETEELVNHIQCIYGEFKKMNSVSPEILKLKTIKKHKVEVEIHYTPIGKHVLFTVNDLSVLRKAERKALENVDRFTKAFRLNPLPMSITTFNEGKILEVNHSFLKASGYTSNQVIGKTTSELGFFDELNFRGELQDHLKNSGSLFKENIKILDKNNNLHICELSADLIYLEGNPHILSVILDKTEQIVQIRKQQESERRFKELLERIELYAVVLDKQGKIVFANNFLMANAGYTSNELIGKNMFKTFVPSGKKRQFQRLFNHKINVRKIPGGFNYPFVLKNNNRRLLHWNNTILLDEKNEQIIGIASIGEDITKRKEMIESIIKSKEKAEQADRLKSAFLANMSHEIRTPLNGILGFSELLKFTTDQNQRNKYLDIINGNGRQLLNLISDIIDIAKIEADQITICPVPTDLNKVLTDLLIQYQTGSHTLQNPDVAIELTTPSGINDKLFYLDENRLKQVLINLLNNAFKFTKKGVIKFGIEQVNNEMMKFFVVDTGKGIPKEFISQVFNRFWQVEQEDEVVLGGTGLGLAICKALVSKMGGEIGVSSKLGVGTEFYFTLTVENYKEVKNNNTKPLNKNWGDKKIYLLEDDETNMQYTMALLDQTKATVMVAKNGEVALNYLKNNITHFDLILLDIRTPGIDGIQLVKELTQLTTQVPILAYSAYAMDEDVAEAIEAGFTDFIKKPVKPFEFFSSIEKYLKL